MTQKTSCYGCHKLHNSFACIPKLYAAGQTTERSDSYGLREGNAASTAMTFSKPSPRFLDGSWEACRQGNPQ